MNDVHNHDLTASQFLKDNIDLLPKGRVLDLAMGRGRNALYMAKIGFDVEGVDISHDKVNIALDKAKKSNIDLTAHVLDLEVDYNIKKAYYDVIICFKYLQRSLIPQIKTGLRKEGVVVYETYIVDQVRFGRPKNPDFLLQHNELLRLFNDFRCLRYYEGLVGEKMAMAGIIAQKVND